MLTTTLGQHHLANNLVAAFARKTGDYAVLSATDLRVLALTYQLEFEACGMKRIRTEPVRPNVQPGNKKPQAAPKRTKHSAKEITGDFEDDTEQQTADGQDQSIASEESQQGNTVLEEDSDDDEEQEDVADNEQQQEDVEKITEHMQNLTAVEGESSSATTEEASTANVEDGNDDEDDDGEWITPDNVKKYSRHGTLKAKKKTRKTLLMQVACTTADYAMQNVLLQMGLNLLSVDGLRISKVKNWVLRCHACTKYVQY